MGLLGSLIDFGTGLLSGHAQKKAANKAAQLQYDAAMKGIAESARQFDVTRSDEMPYMDLGKLGLQHYGDLLGLNGADPQQGEIAALRASPLYKSLYSSGEDAVLANASATGGLRGGNTERSLYGLGEDTLAQLIQQQLAGYGATIGVGSNAVAQTGAFGANAVNAQNQLRGQGADAQAQARLISGGIAAQNWQNFGKVANDAISAIAGGFGGGGGGFNWAKAF